MRTVAAMLFAWAAIGPVAAYAETGAQCVGRFCVNLPNLAWQSPATGMDMLTRWLTLRTPMVDPDFFKPGDLEFYHSDGLGEFFVPDLALSFAAGRDVSLRF